MLIAYSIGGKLLPAFCSKTGAIARGIDFMSNGFSEGSNVYWYKAFSIPGTETVKPVKHSKSQHYNFFPVLESRWAQIHNIYLSFLRENNKTTDVVT